MQFGVPSQWANETMFRELGTSAPMQLLFAVPRHAPEELAGYMRRFATASKAKQVGSVGDIDFFLTTVT
jgi:hypothetical protein